MNELQLRNSSSSSLLPEPVVGTAVAPAVVAPDPVQAIHRSLRGRYLLAFALALIGAAAGGFFGFKSQNLQYRSEGLVRYAYLLPSVTRANQDANLPMTMFDAFLRAQTLQMTGRKMVEQALLEPAWRSVARPVINSEDEVRYFAGNLTVEHPPQTDILQVSFTDRDPVVAAAAVHAVIDVYAKSYSTEEGEFQKKLMTALEDQSKELATEIQTLEDQAATQSGPVDIDAQYNSALQRESDLAAKVNAARRLLVLSQQGNPGEDPAAIIIGELSSADPVISGYLADRQRLSDQLESMKSSGALENNPKYQSVVRALAQVNSHILDYADRIKASAGELATEYEETHKLVQDLASKRLKSTALKNYLDQVGKDLAEVAAKKNQLDLQDRAGSRLTVLSSGDIPLVPFKDRRMVYATGGAGLGAAVPVGLLILLGLGRHKIRSSDEAGQDIASRIPLLGVLPALTRPGDAEAQAGTAHCIHQVRVMLQVGMPRDQHPVYLMTSAASGEGKTGLTAALGLSYAMSGSRTLVVDADLIGRGLTNGFDAEGRPGLHEALAEGTLNGFARETTTRGLWILPAGRADAIGASRLSLPPIRRILDEARHYFDVILVDSGPILGSVEAAVFAQDVDGVVFVVARGQQVPQVKRALNQLQSVGARVAGMVFNRADAKEFARGGYASSYRTRRGQNRNWSSNSISRSQADGDHATATRNNAKVGTPSGSHPIPREPLARSVNSVETAESA